MEKICLNYNMKCDGGTVNLEGNSRMDAHHLPTSKPQKHPNQLGNRETSKTKDFFFNLGLGVKQFMHFCCNKVIYTLMKMITNTHIFWRSTLQNSAL